MFPMYCVIKLKIASCAASSNGGSTIVSHILAEVRVLLRYSCHREYIGILSMNLLFIAYRAPSGFTINSCFAIAITNDFKFAVVGSCLYPNRESNAKILELVHTEKLLLLILRQVIKNSF